MPLDKAAVGNCFYHCILMCGSEMAICAEFCSKRLHYGYDLQLVELPWAIFSVGKPQ